MDPLLQDNIALHRETPLEERVEQALDLMDLGIRMQWTKLENRMPNASEEQVKEKLREWLRSEP